MDAEWLLNILTLFSSISYLLFGAERHSHSHKYGSSRRNSHSHGSRRPQTHHFAENYSMRKKLSTHSKRSQRSNSLPSANDLEEKTKFERVAVKRRPARSRIHKKSALKWKNAQGIPKTTEPSVAESPSRSSSEDKKDQKKQHEESGKQKWIDHTTTLTDPSITVKRKKMRPVEEEMKEKFSSKAPNKEKHKKLEKMAETDVMRPEERMLDISTRSQRTQYESNSEYEKKIESITGSTSETSRSSGSSRRNRKKSAQKDEVILQKVKKKVARSKALMQKKPKKESTSLKITKKTSRMKIAQHDLKQRDFEHEEKHLEKEKNRQKHEDNLLRNIEKASLKVFPEKDTLFAGKHNRHLVEYGTEKVKHEALESGKEQTKFGRATECELNDRQMQKKKESERRQEQKGVKEGGAEGGEEAEGRKRGDEMTPSAFLKTSEQSEGEATAIIKRTVQAAEVEEGIPAAPSLIPDTEEGDNQEEIVEMPDSEQPESDLLETRFPVEMMRSQPEMLEEVDAVDADEEIKGEGVERSREKFEQQKENATGQIHSSHDVELPELELSPPMEEEPIRRESKFTSTETSPQMEEVTQRESAVTVTRAPLLIEEATQREPKFPATEKRFQVEEVIQRESKLAANSDTSLSTQQTDKVATQGGSPSTPPSAFGTSFRSQKTSAAPESSWPIDDANEAVTVSTNACKALEIARERNFFANCATTHENELLKLYFSKKIKSTSRVQDVLFRALDKVIDRIKGIRLISDLNSFLYNRREAISLMIDAMMRKNEYIPPFWLLDEAMAQTPHRASGAPQNMGSEQATSGKSTTDVIPQTSKSCFSAESDLRKRGQRAHSLSEQPLLPPTAVQRSRF